MICPYNTTAAEQCFNDLAIQTAYWADSLVILTFVSLFMVLLIAMFFFIWIRLLAKVMLRW